MRGIYQNSGRMKSPCLDTEGDAQIISVVITICGGLFGDEPDIPTREGLAHAEWDSAGNTAVLTYQDGEGGGATATATGWMQNLADSLQLNWLTPAIGPATVTP